MSSSPRRPLPPVGSEAREAAYERAYRQWVASQTPTARRALRQLGLAEPARPNYATGKGADVAEHPRALAASATGPAPEPEAPGPLTGLAHTQHAALTEFLAGILYEIVEARHPALQAECTALACGLHAARGDTMSEIAARHGRSRQAVSKIVRQIRDRWQLPHNEFTRSDETRELYRLSNRRPSKHAP